VVKKAEAKPAPPAPTPVKSEAARPTAPKPAAKAPTATAAGSAAATGWFVNFGSYTQLDTAESWAARLKPPSGSVAVVTGSKDGKTFYRVRVVELDNRDQAESIARQLEQEHQLSRLWVGKQ
jgi:cell division protein FtsN